MYRSLPSIRYHALNLLIVLLLASSSMGQDIPTIRENFERVVPSGFRKSFCSILKRTIKAQERKDWASLYKLLNPGDRADVSAKQFAKSERGREFVLADFRITSLYTLYYPIGAGADNTWIVSGCVYSRENGKIVDQEGAIKMYLDQGKWYTGMVGIEAYVDYLGPKGCQNEGIDLADLCRKISCK